MKLKELASATDISERTIRYYISDGVFVPEKFSESYTGRKSYDYTENDVKRLKQIALLRKYDFSIKDIKDFFDGKADITCALKENIKRSKENSKTQTENISVMESVLEYEPKTVNELCELLSNPVIEQAPVPNIDEQSAYKPMYEKAKKRIKIIAIIISVILLCHYVVFPFCIYLISQSTTGGNVDSCWVTYVPSEIHSQKEIDEAINHVIKHFALFYRDCTLLEIRYAGDEQCVNESIYTGSQNSESTIVLDCEFETGSTASYDGFENDSEYPWHFVLRKFAGKWFIINQGQA